MRRISKTDWALLMLALAVVSVALLAGLAGSTSPEERAARIADQLRCPTCSGQSVADSPAAIAEEMRRVVDERVAAGDSDEEVRAWFVERYGRWILLEPPVAGVDALLWAAPPLVLVLGAASVVWRARRVPTADGARPPSGARRPTGRVATGLTGAFMLAAIAVPVAMAVGPRFAGQEVSGRPAAAPRTDVDLQELEDRVDERPRDVVALVDLGDALLAADRPGDAAKRYRAALDIEPENQRALLGVGAVLLDADRPDAAVAALDRVLRTTPDQRDALVMRALGNLRMDGRVSDRVRRDLDRFLMVAPDDPRADMARSLLAETPSPLADTPSPLPQGSP